MTKKRILLLLWIMLIMAFMMPMTAEMVFAEADNDINKPTIEMNSLKVTLPNGKEKATIGDTVTFSMEVSDDRRISSVWIELKKPVTGQIKMVYFNYQGNDAETQNGLWTATFTVDNETENGIWKTDMIAAKDTSDNTDHYYDSTSHPYTSPAADLGKLSFEVTAPDCPPDLTTEGYSLMLDGAGATTTFGGNYYINEPGDTVTPTVKVRFDADDETWNTLSSRKYTLKYEKKTGDDSWEDYTAGTFGVDESGTATYRVSATGKASLFYTGTVGPVEFNVIKKYKVIFDTRGGSNVGPQYVIPGEKATKPDDPAREGMFFGHWFSDEQLTNEYSFSAAVNDNITLYADWFANMAIGIYNDSNPNNMECGTVDVETSKQDASWQNVTAMNFTLPEGSVKFTAKSAPGYKFKGFYKGVFGDSGFVKTPSDQLLSEETEYTCDATELAVCAVFECAGHQWEEKIQKATPTADGRVYQKCTICEKEEIITPLLRVSNFSLAETSFIYTGKAITPEVTVANEGEVLSADCYEVSYSNNKNVGTATVKVTLKDDYYEGEKELSFTIKGAPGSGSQLEPIPGELVSIKDAKVELSAAAYTYNGKVQQPAIKTIGGKTLRSGTDYTASWSNASSKNAGTYTVTITGQGSFTGITKASYKINKANNTLKIKGKPVHIKYAKLKKKNQTVKRAKSVSVRKARGKVSYKYAGVDKKKFN